MHRTSPVASFTINLAQQVRCWLCLGLQSCGCSITVYFRWSRGMAPFLLLSFLEAGVTTVVHAPARSFMHLLGMHSWIQMLLIWARLQISNAVGRIYTLSTQQPMPTVAAAMWQGLWLGSHHCTDCKADGCNGCCCSGSSGLGCCKRVVGQLCIEGAYSPASGSSLAWYTSATAMQVAAILPGACWQINQSIKMLVQCVLTGVSL